MIIISKNDELLLLCENLRLLRERDKLTIKEIAKIMKIGVTTYELLEQDILPKSVTVDSIFYVADYFKLAPADLFKTQKEKHSAL